MTPPQTTSTKQDILQLLMKRDQASAVELSSALEITPQAIRRHLKGLEAEGLIEYKSAQIGMGRPQHIYRLSSQGKAKFPKGYGEFALSFLDTLTETVGKEQVSSILRKQWERKAEEYGDRLGRGSLADRVKNLVALRQAEGYMAECYAVEESSNSFVLAEHNCAISDVAASFPSVCGHELEMFSALLPDCEIERTHWLIDGEHRCGYLITSQVGVRNSPHSPTPSPTRGEGE